MNEICCGHFARSEKYAKHIVKLSGKLNWLDVRSIRWQIQIHFKQLIKSYRFAM